MGLRPESRFSLGWHSATGAGARKQDDDRGDEGQRQYVASGLSEQARDERRERLDQKGRGIEAADDGEDRQKNADERPDLAAVLRLALLRWAIT